MANIVIKTSTRLPAAQVSEVEQKLAQAYAQARSGAKAVTYQIAYDDGAPPVVAYGQVGRAVAHPTGDQGTCYAIYLAAIAVGVPEDIAWAAYLICLAS